MSLRQFLDLRAIMSDAGASWRKRACLHRAATPVPQAIPVGRGRVAMPPGPLEASAERRTERRAAAGGSFARLAVPASSRQSRRPA